MLTQFQRTHLEQIRQQPDFKHFCYEYLTSPQESQTERTRNFLFITTDNKLHAHRVGPKRLVATITH
jgi:hypothetical protein